MPLPRREKTTYNDIRQPATEQVPHIPSSPPNPVCIRQSVQKYRDRVMPDWFQKVTEEADKCQKLKRGRARYAKDESGPSAAAKDKSMDKSKESRRYYGPAGISEASCGALQRRWFRGQAGSGSLYRCPPLSCYYRQYARDSGVCQSFVPLLHTMRLSEELRAPQLSPVQQRKRRPLQCAARAMR
ncbi:hypothetical protein HPB51_006453 [Rhipicephalus microplus]|uniref:Uncharacterized protein n=1 Tax=Rhipicephalus microplus TaxID=6941 RepID=A0A9J6E7E3_RHIMP|nr:hypothetical protein HPB51_006453 [Rhipicephalus microplus]